MGKKGSWFSAIKRVFTHNSKEKRADEPNKEKKKGKGILRHGETKSFIPLFREPSSIEKILGEADRLLIRPPTPLEQPKSHSGLPARPVSPRVASPKAAFNIPSPNVASPSIEKIMGEADQLLIRPTPLEMPKLHPGLPIRPVSPRVASPKAASNRPSPKDASPRVCSPIAPASPRVASPRAVSPEASRPRTFSNGTISPKAAPARALTTKDVSSKAAPLKVFITGAGSSKAASPKKTRRNETIYVQRPEPTLRDQQRSATKIQAAYRGYLARQSFRALKGLVRLQGVVKGQNVKRQTANAMKQMQLLVRVQTQIQSRRIHVLENQALQHQVYKHEKEAESKLTLNQLLEAGRNEDWDDSSLTKEEVEERLQKKVEAVIKRERAMAYAHSHQLWKSTPKSVQNPSDVRSNGYPWWRNWLERQLPQVGSSQSQAATRNTMLTPPRPNSEYKSSASPRLQLHESSCKLGNFTSDNHESTTPRSSRSAIPFRARQFQTTPNRSPLASSSSYAKYSKPRASAAYDAPLKDDDSLVSCPPFSVPNYMTPTVSAKVKLRANSNPRERFTGTPGSDSNRRLSFPMSPNVDPFKWNKGSNRDSASQTGIEKREEMGYLSVDSTVSVPAALVGRKPFNRFV